MTEATPKMRHIKSFVRRAGRLSPRQQEGLTQTLQKYVLPLQETPWQLSSIFERTADTVVEIGFGSGASLFTMAKEAPHKNFIGIEVYQAGIGSLVSALEEEKLINVRIAPYDAVTLFNQCLEDNALTGVQIFFPDPWPKKRHHKRRLIQSGFVQLLLKRLKSGGFLHCATDWASYAAHMYDVLSREPLISLDQFRFQAGSDITTLDSIREHPIWAISQAQDIPCDRLRPLTRFETRGIKLGHSIWDFVYQKR